MGWVQDWLQATTCAVLGPQREEQVRHLARRMAGCMRREGKFFNFNEAASYLGVPEEDRPIVKERLYELTLRYVLEDYQITEKDRAGLHWIARGLGLSEEQAHRIELRVGRRVFEEYLAFAIAGGYLDAEELGQLRAVAGSLGMTSRHLLLGYLAESGEQFLMRLATGMAENGQVSDAAWHRFLGSVHALGLAEEEIVRVLRLQARRLAEAGPSRLDPELVADETSRQVIRHLLDRFESTRKKE